MSFTSRSKSGFIDFLLPVVIGSVSFFIIFGYKRLNPSNIAWLSHTGWQDGWGAYLGWESYRQSIWTNPIGLNSNYGLDIGNSLIYTDSIPLFSIPLKLFNNLLPNTFQFFGIWIYCCLIMQALLSWKIMKGFTDSRIFLVFSTLLFVYSPIMLNRSNTHMSQVAHFLILFGLYLNLRDTKNHFTFSWPLLIILSVLVHPYFFVINLILFVANLIDKKRREEVSRSFGLRVFLWAVLVSIITIWQSGYFVSIDGAKNPFPNTLFKMDLLQPFNFSGWSFIFSSIFPLQVGNIEGFNFLGFGIITLISIFLFLVPKRFDIMKESIFYRPALFISLTFFLFYSLTYKVTIARRSILEIELSSFLVELFSAFRASGRFFAPVYYSIYIFVLVSLIRRFELKTASTILLFVTILQLTDSSYNWREISKITENKSLAISQEFNSIKLNSNVKFQEQILVLPEMNTPGFWCNWQSIGYVAIQYNLSTNCIYFARVSESGKKKSYSLVREMLEANNIPKGTLIYLTTSQEMSLKVHPKLKYVETKNGRIFYSYLNNLVYGS